MMDFWITPERLFDGTELTTGLSVRISDNRVAEVAPARRAARRLSGTLVPGFVDLQVNGGGGIQLNTDPSRDGMAAIAAAHRQSGTVAILPTVITDHPDVLDACVDAAIAAQGDVGIAGLHIEGPHISTTRRGTHDAQYVRPMDTRTLTAVRVLRDADVTVMITLAPEAATNSQIAQLSDMGAIVSLGHTDARAETVEGAIAAGARCATHLFNAMSPMTSRAPGAVGAVIDSGIYAGLICDGHHVDDRMIRLALRGRPVPDRVFLVSDAMATVNGPDSFMLYGQQVSLRDGRLVNAEGSLAGAHVTQAEGLRHLIGQVGIDPAAALRMVTSIPAAAIDQPDLGQLIGRRADDLLLISNDWHVSRTLADACAAAAPVDAAS